jgi:hypothetical protein
MMGIAKGTYLNGIRDEATLLARCRVDEVSGCWRYLGNCAVGVMPTVHIVMPDGTRVCRRVRRAAWIIKTGAEPARGLVAYPTPDCRYIDCLCTSHVKVGTRRQATQAASERGAYDTLQHIAARSALQQAKRKISAETQMEIMRSDEPTTDLMARTGLSRSRINGIRRGARHATSKATSVFEWRGQA